MATFNEMKAIFTEAYDLYFSNKGKDLFIAMMDSWKDTNTRFETDTPVMQIYTPFVLHQQRIQNAIKKQALEAENFAPFTKNIQTTTGGNTTTATTQTGEKTSILRQYPEGYAGTETGEPYLVNKQNNISDDDTQTTNTENNLTITNTNEQHTLDNIKELLKMNNELFIELQNLIFDLMDKKIQGGL